MGALDETVDEANNTMSTNDTINIDIKKYGDMTSAQRQSMANAMVDLKAHLDDLRGIQETPDITEEIDRTYTAMGALLPLGDPSQLIVPESETWEETKQRKASHEHYDQWYDRLSGSNAREEFKALDLSDYDAGRMVTSRMAPQQAVEYLTEPINEYVRENLSDFSSNSSYDDFSSVRSHVPEFQNRIEVAAHHQHADNPEISVDDHETLLTEETRINEFRDRVGSQNFDGLLRQSAIIDINSLLTGVDNAVCNINGREAGEWKVMFSDAARLENMYSRAESSVEARISNINRIADKERIDLSDREGMGKIGIDIDSLDAVKERLTTLGWSKDHPGIARLLSSENTGCAPSERWNLF